MDVKKCSLLFKCLCYAAAWLLSCYWLYKFVVEDEDLCNVDYKTLESAKDDATIPMLSVCFRNPFIEKNLKGTQPDLNYTHYLNYITG